MKLSSVVLDEERFRKFLFADDNYSVNFGNNRAIDFICSIDRERTPQGGKYWVSRYYWLYEQCTGYKLAHFKEPMTEEDWKYLRSLLPRETPKDEFLTDKNNAIYLSI